MSRTARARPRDWALPALAGIVLALSFPPARLLVPAFIGLAPLLVFIAERPADPGGRWDATRAGLLTGALFFGIQLYWIAVALLDRSLLAIPAYLGAVLVLAGLVGGFGWAIHFTRHRTALPLPLLAALLWTTLEWVQGHLGDLAFPWLGLGAALTPFPTLAGAADLVGSRGLAFWIAAVNGAVAVAVLRNRAGRREAPALLVLLLLLAAPAGYGAYRTASIQMRPIARVGLVQPDIPDDVKRGPLALDSSVAALTRLTGLLAPERPELVVWPEAALPVDLPRRPRLRLLVDSLARYVDAPLLVGAFASRPEGTFNSAFLVGGDSTPPTRYDKQRLVPFIERVPFIEPVLPAGGTDAPAGRRTGRLQPGAERALLHTRAGEPFGVLICYESIFPRLARDYRRRGARFLVNITNDAWYGRDRWWGRTTGLWQHPAHMVLRAIETRAGVARVANTGFSLFIDPLGRVYGRTALFEPAVRAGVVYTTDEPTLFVRWGDWLAGAAAGFSGLLLLAAWLRPDLLSRGERGPG